MQYFLARAPRSCLVPGIIAIILGVLFLGTLIALIVVATTITCDTTSSSPSQSIKSSSSSLPLIISSSSSSSSSVEPPEYAVSFTEFTAETFTYYFFKEAPTNSRKGNIQKEYVFNDFKWSNEEYYNGELFLRTFSTEDDNSITMCMNVSSHGNCYRMTSEGTGGLQIPYEVPIKEMGIPCYEIFPDLKDLLPSRNLDKCDFYGEIDRDMNIFSLDEYSFSGDSFAYYLVENGTNYPVMIQEKESGEGYSTMILYTSFKPGKPEDESGLKPFPGVTVYDFRDGEGDVDEGKSDLHAESKKNKKNKSIRQTKHTHRSSSMGIFPITPSRVRAAAALRDVSTIPEEFDARNEWPACTDIIGIITDQDICGSCWAMASAGVLSDRLCISENIEEQLSPQYMVYCGEHSRGCQGGQTISAWDDLIDRGTVSESCVPFTGRFGECPEVCKDYSEINILNKVYPIGYVFPWGDTNESRVQAIQSEIMTNGPVLASFLTFDDFQTFFYNNPRGIYHRSKEATCIGKHAVRIIGWGTSEEGEDYWLVANSWGISWADNGVFRIRRGNNECNIEEQVGGLIL